MCVNTAAAKHGYRDDSMGY